MYPSRSSKVTRQLPDTETLHSPPSVAREPMDSPAAGSAPHEPVEVTSHHQRRHDITYAIFECAS